MDPNHNHHARQQRRHRQRLAEEHLVERTNERKKGDSRHRRQVRVRVRVRVSYPYPNPNPNPNPKQEEHRAEGAQRRDVAEEDERIRARKPRHHLVRVSVRVRV